MSDNGCVTYPGVPGSPGSPAQINYFPDFGWDAGGNSVAVISGPCILDFTVANPTGVLIGLSAAANQYLNPYSYFHAFFLQIVANQPFYSIVEQGVTVVNPIARPFATTDETGNPADEFAIERTGFGVNYYLNGTIIATRDCLFTKPAVVAAMLYASGDYIG